MNKINKTLIFLLFIIFFSSINKKFVLANSKKTLLLEQTLELKYKAKKAYQNGEYNESLSIWSKLLKEQKLNPNNKAKIHCYIAETYNKIGLLSKAINHWQDAIIIYRESKRPESLKLLTQVILDKAQAHNVLGQTQNSKILLEEAIYLANREKYTELEAKIYQTLGNNFLIEGKLDSAISNYFQSLSAAKDINNNELIVVAHSNLSNSYHLKYLQLSDQANFAKETDSLDHEKLLHQSSLVAKRALYNTKQAVARIENNETLYSVEANLHLLKLSEKYTKAGLIKSNLNQEYIRIVNERTLLLPNSTRKAQALIELAQFKQKDISGLNQALEIAEKIDDLRTQSLALGSLGKIYEQSQNYNQALKLTYQAQKLAKQTRANDILYRWEWQLGRIYSQIKQDKDAQIAYQRAINSLQLIRRQIASTKNYQLQIDFKLNIEPVYRESIELLLKDNNSQLELKQALEIKKLLQLSELENFFGENCIIVKKNLPPTNLTSKTSKIHTFILNQKTYFILELPDKKMKKILLPISSNQLLNMIEKWRFNLENQADEQFLLLSQQLYELLIEKLEPELTATSTQKIIFINDKILRNVPMAALHDGKKFLIEKYTISNSLDFEIESQNLNNSKKARILAFGLESSSTNLPSLPQVKQELDSMESNFGAKTFINDQFNLKNFQKETDNSKYNIIHIATHGRFGGTAENTFLQAYQRKINLKEFEEILNQRRIDNNIDLLTLTACDTAVGNNRAILGLAGVAIRANIDNVLGTLWNISDQEIVNLISTFYHYWLNENYPKSEALRLAKIDMLKNPNYHPAIWSSLILIES